MILSLLVALAPLQVWTPAAVCVFTAPSRSTPVRLTPERDAKYVELIAGIFPVESTIPTAPDPAVIPLDTASAPARESVRIVASTANASVSVWTCSTPPCRSNRIALRSAPWSVSLRYSAGSVVEMNGADENVQAPVADVAPLIVGTTNDPAIVMTVPLSLRTESVRMAPVAHFAILPAVPDPPTPPLETTVTTPPDDAPVLEPPQAMTVSPIDAGRISPSTAVTFRRTRIPAVFWICTSVITN